MDTQSLNNSATMKSASSAVDSFSNAYDSCNDEISSLQVENQSLQNVSFMINRSSEIDKNTSAISSLTTERNNYYASANSAISEYSYASTNAKASAVGEMVASNNSPSSQQVSMFNNSYNQNSDNDGSWKPLD